MTGFLYLVGFIVIMVLAPLLAMLFFNLKKPHEIIAKHKGTEMGKSVFVKKYPEADTNRFVSTFIGVGLVIALGVVIIAFLYEPSQARAYTLSDVEAFEDFEIEPPQTQREPPPPPEPPAPGEN